MLGLRGDAKAVDGDAPFYEYPFVEMRGIKVMRYQGDKTLLGEAELRWFFTPRWALVGFGGAARTFSGFASGDSDVIYSKGLGIRYLIARKLGLQAGIRCPPWRAKRRRVVPGSREATRDTRRAEGAKGDPKGASERGVQSYGRPVCSRNELAMLWRNAG